MVYATASDALLRSVLTLAYGTFALAAAMVAASALLRALRALSARREMRVRRAWRAVFAECAFGVPETLPRIRRGDGAALLAFFNYHHQVLRGGPTQNLNAVAQRAGFDTIARDMLDRRSVRYQLVGAAASGNMRDAASWDRLRPLLDDPVTSVSLFAARALLQIHPMLGSSLVVERAAARHDWHAAKLAIVLQESSPEDLSPPLVRAIERAAADALPSLQLARLVRLLHFADAARAADAVRRTFRAHGADTDIAIACLRALVRREDADLARIAVTDERWAVRAVAATTLGRIGSPDDAAAIARLVDDAQWWVRHRAAQALLDLTDASDALAPQTERARLTLAHERAARFAA